MQVYNVYASVKTLNSLSVGHTRVLAPNRKAALEYFKRATLLFERGPVWFTRISVRLNKKQFPTRII